MRLALCRNKRGGLFLCTGIGIVYNKVDDVWTNCIGFPHRDLYPEVTFENSPLEVELKLIGKMKYKVGDKVKLVSHLIHTGGRGYGITGLHDWLGKVVTIDTAKDGLYTTLEVKGHFLPEFMIEGLVSDARDEVFKEVMREQWDAFKRTAAIINKRYMSENNTKNMGEVSDGHHTFNELYEYRMLYNAALFNEFAKQGLYDVHKSRKHSDGCYPFGDPNWFIVMAELPTGQISNHYEMKDWDKFQIPEKPVANKWDEHSPKDVADRLTSFTTPKKEYPKTYEECEKILELEDSIIEGCLGYEYKLLNAFQKLLMCRNAYWKIAGEEMGLWKPWEPDWDATKDNHFYTIHTFNGEIYCSGTAHRNAVLIFPTEEMRDAFKENFDPDIEFCKELL